MVKVKAQVKVKEERRDPKGIQERELSECWNERKRGIREREKFKMAC